MEETNNPFKYYVTLSMLSDEYIEEKRHKAHTFYDNFINLLHYTTKKI